MRDKLELVNDLSNDLLNYSYVYKRYIKIPPVLRNKESLYEVIKFISEYFSGNKQTTLKNAHNLKTVSASESKMHLWMQILLYNTRVSYAIKQTYDPVMSHKDWCAQYRMVFPVAPIILKSAVKKYKYITVFPWTDSQFNYCYNKELDSVNRDDILPLYEENDQYSPSENTEFYIILKDIMEITDSLEKQGNYDLSEKLLSRTDQLSALADKLSYDY